MGGMEGREFEGGIGRGREGARGRLGGEVLLDLCEG